MKRSLLLVAILSMVTVRPAPAAATAPSQAIADPAVRELVRLVNQHRVSIGCRPLRWNARLARVAQRHSEDMARRGFFSHVNPDGLDPFERMEHASLDFSRAAENIAAGQTTAREVFSGWMASGRHRANLEACALTEHGIGHYDHQWTHDFMTPRSSPHPRRFR